MTAVFTLYHEPFLVLPGAGGEELFRPFIRLLQRHHQGAERDFQNEWIEEE
jgi:hypothetical protein